MNRRTQREKADNGCCGERIDIFMRSKIALALLAGALALPLLHAQGPAPDGGQAGPDDGPGARRKMGPGGRDGWRRGGDGWRGGGFRGMHRGRGEFALARIAANPEMREKLGLTAEQVGKISQQTSDYKKASIRSRADLGVKRVELADLLRVETPDRAAIDRKLDEIGAGRAAQAKAQVHYRLAMREVLTPEQRTKLRQMREDRMPQRYRGRQDGERRGPRGPREPGQGDE